jgi:hypothetical protein
VAIACERGRTVPDRAKGFCRTGLRIRATIPSAATSGSRVARGLGCRGSASNKCECDDQRVFNISASIDACG